MTSEQHLPYRATGDVVVLDGDGSRWVREDVFPCPSWADGVPVPADRDGNVVPLATRTLYCGDGSEVEVGEIALVDSKLSGGLVWRARTPGGVALVLDLLHLERPDSWEQLEKDAAKHPCEYFGKEGGREDGKCVGCPARYKVCYAVMTIDIARRAKALAESDAND